MHYCMLLYKGCQQQNSPFYKTGQDGQVWASSCLSLHCKVSYFPNKPGNNNSPGVEKKFVSLMYSQILPKMYIHSNIQ